MTLAAAPGGMVTDTSTESPSTLHSVATRPGIVPIQVWEFEHAVDGGPGHPVVATFGPFAEVSGPGDDWRPAEWSLSRGIRQDPIHDESLGPNGYVPEEFLLWRGASAGGRYRARTTITVPDDPAVRLAIGANAARTARFRGAELETGEAGYLTFSELPPGEGMLELEFTAAADADLRAFFALTTDPERFARPEWIEAADAPARSTSVVFSTAFELDGDPDDARVQLSTEAPGILVVNGTEVGRQSDFDPYSARRFTRVHPYDLRTVLRAGRNTIQVRSTDIGRPVAIRLDSVPRADGGLGIRTDSRWTVSREGRPAPLRQRYQQFEDPRYGCLVPRPHPLQGASWLEPESAHGSVVRLVPDVAPQPVRMESLSFDLPIGTVEATVPSDVPFEVTGPGVTKDGSRLRFESPTEPGRRMTVRFSPGDGRRGGALLDGPIVVTTESAEAELAAWDELGLATMGGAVHYERAMRVDAPAGARVVLDLGEVRGTAEVLIDGELADTLFAGPWRSDVTAAIRPGAEHRLEIVVRGTLAPYLAVASPTAGVLAGQRRLGLFGPVAVEIWNEREQR